MEAVEKEVEEIAEVVEEVAEEETVGESTDSSEEVEEDEKPDWLKAEGDSVPLATLLKTKGKLKGQIAERDTENELLKEKIKNLENSRQAPTDSSPLKRPRERDFDTDDEYDLAMDEYEIKKDELNFNRATQHNSQNIEAEQFNNKIANGVSDHYKRVEEFITQQNVAPDVYKAADSKLRQAVEDIRPQQGNSTVDLLLTELGAESEKVVMYIGNNADRLKEFQDSLRYDPRGIKTAILLGKAQEAVKLNKKRTSQAPKPASNVSGSQTPMKSGALKKAYDKAEGQEAYNIKKRAKDQGVDVKEW